jgi:hypothetical protein
MQYFLDKTYEKLKVNKEQQQQNGSYHRGAG